MPRPGAVAQVGNVNACFADANVDFPACIAHVAKRFLFIVPDFPDLTLVSPAAHSAAAERHDKLNPALSGRNV